MSYPDLARHLDQLSDQLKRHGARLEGAALAKAAATLEKALSAFGKKLEAALRGADPSLEAIEQLLKSPAKKLIKVPVWQKLLREVHQVRGAEGTAAQLQKHFIKLCRERGNGEAAFHVLDRQVKGLAVPAAPVPKEKAALQAEFLRLGGLAEEDAMVELALRWKTPALKALARHNAIPVAEGAKRERLEREILAYARRAHSNIRS